VQCLSCGRSERICLSDEKYSKIPVEFPGSRRDILTRMGSYTEQANLWLDVRMDSTMAKAMTKVPPAVLAALQGSGFPFQTAVAHVIRAVRGWSVHASEYPWRTSVGDYQFLDLVATNHKLFLTVECKKTRKEILTFLRPLGHSHTGKLQEFRCLRSGQLRDSTGRPELFCEEWALYPPSTSSEFCVVSTSDSGRDQRLLEKDAGLVVRATDAFAHYFPKQFRPDRDGSPSDTRLFVPVIVTNAPIYTARYTPSEVSLESGEFAAPPEEVESAPWVRFRKAFMSDSAVDLGDRSVFVVNAAAFAEFLDLIETAPSQPQDRVEVRFL